MSRVKRVEIEWGKGALDESEDAPDVSEDARDESEGEEDPNRSKPEMVGSRMACLYGSWALFFASTTRSNS